ncbi:Spy/CpxP family protein refolding chaperone [Prosthecobacter sp. SYSU 5D2]|uniref:Spy/CpxP family protein refolding chaperone n=1 Tax=Prosthecobacter sp. SYSU 5D2 TaxID=3134134 RepID=UPI0031FE47D7
MKHFLLSLLITTGCLAAGPEALLQSGLLSADIITVIKPELDLTEEQESRMTGIVTAARAESEPLEMQVKEQQKAFNQILRQPDSTPEVASAALARLMEAEAAVKQLQLRTLLGLRDVLTLEQQKKAVALAQPRQVKRADLETRVREKAARLRLAVQSLGVPATTSMVQRGSEVEALVKEGDLAAADAALDRLVVESQVDAPESPASLDFSTYDPGETDVETLKQRYQAVETAAQSVLSLPLLRQLIQARQALEEAKALEDAETVGRILTWAEKILGL